MTSAGSTEAQEQSTATFRRLMRSGGDEASRVQLLTSLLPRRVLVATWPGTAEAVRTLTNGAGEQAMPLFTGMDMLQGSAARFGWIGADGSLSYRELDARDALRSALAHEVHFIVVDIGAEHALEFARDEIQRVLRPSRIPAANLEAPRPYTRSRPAAAPRNSRQPPRVLSQLDTPFAEERTTSRTLMPPLDKPADPRPPARAARPAAVPAPAGASAGRDAGGPDRRAVEPAAPDVQAKGQPVRRTDQGIAPPHATTLPPTRGESAPAPANASDFPSLPPLPGQAVAHGIAPMAPAISIAPSAARAAPAAEVELPVLDADLPPLEEFVTPPAAPAAVSVPAPAPPPAVAAKPPAVPAAPAAAAADTTSFRAPDRLLDEELLRQVSEVLRKYPEVEWACQVADATEVPVIGLRIATAFTGRASEIRTAVERLCAAQRTPVTVLALGDREPMREARAKGDMFFPWRKRVKR